MTAAQRKFADALEAEARTYLRDHRARQIAAIEA